MLGYFGDFPTVIEQHGLTDAWIAHRPLEARGRIGHEKGLHLLHPYLAERGVDLVLGPWRGDEFPEDPIGAESRVFEFHMESVPYYGIPRDHWFRATLITYDRDVLDAVADDPTFRFPRFEDRLDEYIRSIDSHTPPEVLADLAAFRQFYFDHNDDPARLAAFTSIAENCDSPLVPASRSAIVG
jgi:hypothetical protein